MKNVVLLLFALSLAVLTSCNRDLNPANPSDKPLTK